MDFSGSHTLALHSMPSPHAAEPWFPQLPAPTAEVKELVPGEEAGFGKTKEHQLNVTWKHSSLRYSLLEKFFFLFAHSSPPPDLLKDGDFCIPGAPGF